MPLSSSKGELVQEADGRWRKGAKISPTGRVSQAWTPEMREAFHNARKLSIRAIQKLSELLDCGDVRVELKAAETLLLRVYGAPKASEPEEQDEAPKVNLEDLPHDERLALLEDAAVNVQRALELERLKAK